MLVFCILKKKGGFVLLSEMNFGGNTDVVGQKKP
jgi:hypothetical protein